MSDSRQLPQKREDESSDALTWAKWGLMGVGAVVVAGWALSLLSWMFPLIIIGALGFGAWKIFGPETKKGPKQLTHVSDDQWLDARAAAERNAQDLQEFDRKLAAVRQEQKR